jgi:hypothetical protein
VTGDSTSGYISVLLGKGDGTFSAPSNIRTSGPGIVVVGDLNRDGIPDIIATINGSDFGVPPHAIAVLIGNGDGTFVAPIYYATQSSPGALAVSDFNHDGKLDIAYSNQDGSIGIQLGNGDGTLGPSSYFSVGAVGQIVIADLNGDGNVDLAIPGGANGVSVFLGNGDGTFVAPINSPVGPNPRNLAVGDLNEDGLPDLITIIDAPVNQGGNAGFYNIAVLPNNGDGTFGAPTTYPAGLSSAAITIGDLNGDGILDVAIPNQTFLNGGFGANLSFESLSNR